MLGVFDENRFESVANTMLVKVQPKVDQRARYASDGPRFLPDARKHPMSIQVCLFHSFRINSKSPNSYQIYHQNPGKMMKSTVLF